MIYQLIKYDIYIYIIRIWSSFDWSNTDQVRISIKNLCCISLLNCIKLFRDLFFPYTNFGYDMFKSKQQIESATVYKYKKGGFNLSNIVYWQVNDKYCLQTNRKTFNWIYSKRLVASSIYQYSFRSCIFLEHYFIYEVV